MTYEFGLRERKKAQLKLDLLSAILEELKKHSFDEIKVATICDNVSISEVTFFKYFDRKDELLLYYMQVWNYKRELRIHTEGRAKGRDAIYSIFDDIAQTADAKKKMNTLVSYFSRLKHRPKTVQLSVCEKWLINKELVIEDSMELDEQMALAIDEAKKSGQLSQNMDDENIHIMLATLFYGTSLICHMTGEDLRESYKNSLDIIFNKVRNKNEK